MNAAGLPQLNLPPFDARLRPAPGGGLQIFDPSRTKWVALTPEEHVRQAFTAYLTAHLGYPRALMANEVALKLNGTLRRCDTVVFDRRLKPAVIVEYKAPSVALTQAVFDQIVRYNMVLQAPLLMVSNGLRHACCRVDYDTRAVTFLDEIPPWHPL